MAVRADQGLTGLAEPFQMDLVANAVAGTGEPDTVLCGNSLQIPVVVCIFKATLQGVVVYIGNTQFSLNLGNTHGFKFQICHCTGGILCQCLVDPQSYLTAGSHIPGN